VCVCVISRFAYRYGQIQTEQVADAVGLTDVGYFNVIVEAIEMPFGVVGQVTPRKGKWATSGWDVVN